MKELEQKAFDQFKEMMNRGYLDGIVVYDLVNALTYSIQEDGEKELVEALKVVLAYYTTKEDYGRLIREVV